MLRFSKASVELYERTGRDRWEGNLLGGSEWRAIRLQRKAAARLSNSRAGYYLQGAVAGHYEDSRFSAISSILVTEFQLRPVPGVFRILWMRGQGSLD
jgi:hypothetical protein